MYNFILQSPNYIILYCNIYSIVDYLYIVSYIIRFNNIYIHHCTLYTFILKFCILEYKPNITLRLKIKIRNKKDFEMDSIVEYMDVIKLDYKLLCKCTRIFLCKNYTYEYINRVIFYHLLVSREEYNSSEKAYI